MSNKLAERIALAYDACEDTDNVGCLAILRTLLAELTAHDAAKPAEPWGYANRRDGQAWSRVVLEGWHAHNMARYDLPLYAAPVAVASPLTADQIEAMPVWKHFIGLMPEHRLEFTRAIEAHHGIKEQA